MASWVSSAVSFVAESAASTVVEMIVEKGFSYLRNLMQIRDSEAELKRLKMALPKIKSVMAIAEALKAKDPSYGEWFEQFRRAVDASEDVLDELEYKELEDAVKKHEEVGRSASHPKKEKPCTINKETLGRLREAVRMLDQAIGDVDCLLQCASMLGIDGFSEYWKEASKFFRPETTSLLVERKVFGRDDEKEKIIGWLNQSTQEPLSVFGIIGMGGLGKTTLAQLANQEMKGSNYFDHTIWICVSIEFSFESLTRKILGELEENCGDKPLNALQETLKEKIRSKKIFLILDDIWDDEKHWRGWEQFLAPLKFAQESSKILFTSRMISVAALFAKAILTRHESLILKGLKEQELRSLFYNYAFHGYNPENHTDLQILGDQIIKMIRGNPLAAKVIGSLLNSHMDYNYWRRILNHGSVFNINQAKDVVEVLKLSYYHLPADLQVCFRFCSIFPQDYEFNKDELIKMWMAAGFIQQQLCQEKRPEDVGEDYFNYLLSRSFFEYSKSRIGERYAMHDLMHELAQNISNGECCRVQSDNEPVIIPNSIRHISLHESDIERISHLENLHSLVITTSYNVHVRTDPFVLPKKLSKKSLRLLRISTYSNCQISEEIIDSVHLRYLSIKLNSSSRSKCLLTAPIHKFYHLQLLEVSGVDHPYSSDLRIEPGRMNNLGKLRYMRLPVQILKTIPRVHKLTFLQELTLYVGQKGGHRINELTTLKDLYKLAIYNIENVGDPADAKSANLLGKKNLKILSLNWSSESHLNNPEQIIDNLQPNPDLMELTIRNYKGQRSPSWMMDLSPLNLLVLKLLYCPRWKDLLFSCQIPYLKILDIRECQELDRLPDMPLSLIEFRVEEVGLTYVPNLCQISNTNTRVIVPQKSSLKIVEIKGCPNLISLDGFLHQDSVNLQDIEKLTIENCEKLIRIPTQGFGNLRSLKYLRMVECPNLTGYLYLPHSLTALEIWNVSVTVLHNLPLSVTQLVIRGIPVGALPEYNTTSDSSGGPSTESQKSSLTDVIIDNCPNLTSLNGFLQQVYIDFQSITYIAIVNCRNLVRLPIDVFGKFVSLKLLKIRECPMLVAVDNQRNLLPMTLKDLTIANCGELDVQLLESTSHLIALTELHIQNCANITHIPCSENTFRSLSTLDITECDKLVEQSFLEPAHTVNLSRSNLPSLKIKELCIDQPSLLLIEPLRSLRFVSELTIRNCLRMDAFPEQWLMQNNSTLKSLRIEESRTLKSLPASIARCTALTELDIRQCDLLEEIHELPASLRILTILKDARSLKSLPTTMASLALEELRIRGAELLEQLPELPDSLRILEIWNARSLKSLPATMASLTALEELTIWGADMLEEVPELPRSLEFKSIRRSDGTQLCT